MTAGHTVALIDAMEAFFADKDIADNTRRTYHQTLDAIASDAGPRLSVEDLTSDVIHQTLVDRWGAAAPSTWNSRLTALQSFTRYCQDHGWLEHDPLKGVQRKREPRDETKAISHDDLDALWSRPNVGLREKTLWRMLYETAARASEILALDIEHLDLGRKRAVVIGKGGHRETVVWASGTARLLPPYLSGRRRGPVFVTERQPNMIPAEVDRCPDTGRGRLSYQQAWAKFSDTSNGWTLHQLRHSALTHLGEAGVSTILLQAKSRHQDPRTLARYAKPGVEAVAALTAEHDPGRRNRQTRA